MDDSRAQREVAAAWRAGHVAAVALTLVAAAWFALAPFPVRADAPGCRGPLLIELRADDEPSACTEVAETRLGQGATLVLLAVATDLAFRLRPWFRELRALGNG